MSEADMSLAQALGAFATGNLSNAHPEVRAMAIRIRALYAGARLSGPARTVRITPGDNAAIHRAVHTAEPGDVLVVDAGESEYYGPFGDILASACMARGITGMAIDGTVRDSEEIAALQFPIFCIGCNPQVTAKTDPGEVGGVIHCGGLTVRPGDYVVGDGDGVVVVPKELTAEVVERAQKVVEKEEDIRAQIAAGRTTYEIFGLGEIFEVD